MAIFSISNLSLKKVAVLAGFTFGAFALSAVAANYTAPTFTPPNCPDGTPGCNVPLNIGAIFQRKEGKLGLGSANSYSTESLRPLLDVNGTGMFSTLGVVNDLLIGGKATVTNLAVKGGTPTAGKVLTAVDTDGNATWQSSSGNIAGSLMFGNSSTFTLPAGTWSLSVSATYFTCKDYKTYLNFDGVTIGSHGGADEAASTGVDTNGCDQNTLMGTVNGVAGGQSHTLTVTTTFGADYDSDRDFTQKKYSWIAMKTN